MYIFLDESGNFTEDKDKYFIVGGFITGNPRRTAKAFRRWQHTKFSNRKLRYRAEVKFSDTRLNEKLRLKTLEYFTKQDIRIFYTFLKNSNIPLEHRKKQQIESGFLYAEIIAQTLQLLSPTSDLEFRIFRDQRHLKKIPQAKFNKSLKLDLLPNLPAKALVQIETLNSASNPNIQIADWICGALFRYHNKGKNAKQYFSILKNSIIVSKELFENYWQTLYKNKKPPQKR